MGAVLVAGVWCGFVHQAAPQGHGCECMGRGWAILASISKKFPNKAIEWRKGLSYKTLSSEMGEYQSGLLQESFRNWMGATRTPGSFQVFEL